MHPRDQFLKGKRLGQIVVRAHVQALDAVTDPRRRGQHQDPGVRLAVAQADTHGVAVNARKIAVQDDHVVVVHQALLQRCRPVIREIGRDAAVAQSLGDVAGQLHVILDHQDAHTDILNHPT